MASPRVSTCRCLWRCPRLNAVKKSTNTKYNCWTSNSPGRISAGNTVRRSTSVSAGGIISSFYCKNWWAMGTWKRTGLNLWWGYEILIIGHCRRIRPITLPGWRVRLSWNKSRGRIKSKRPTSSMSWTIMHTAWKAWRRWPMRLNSWSSFKTPVSTKTESTSEDSSNDKSNSNAAKRIRTLKTFLKTNTAVRHSQKPHITYKYLMLLKLSLSATSFSSTTTLL
jgi:hypothetical protein